MSLRYILVPPSAGAQFEGVQVDIFSNSSTNGEILIDSDTIAFRAAAATDGRMYSAGNQVFKYKADALAYCQENGVPEDEIEIDYFPEPVEAALAIVSQCVQGIYDDVNQSGWDTMKMFFFHTGDDNFRYDIFPEYKANRIGVRKPAHLKACKDYIASKWGEVIDSKLEADDLIGIRAHELRAKGIPYVVVSNDKDLKTIPGTYRNWVDRVTIDVTPMEAMSFFYAQVLAGDDADGIPGIKGLGVNKEGTGKAQKIMLDIAHRAREIGIGMEMIEPILYFETLTHWIEGGPGKSGNYGCIPIEVVEEKRNISAKLLYILHEKGKLWEPPFGSHRNFVTE